MIAGVSLSDLTNPRSPWSVWVPLLFLAMIVAAAIYFVRLRAR